MIKKAILEIQKQTGASPYDIMQAFIYGAIWGLVIALSVYPACWILIKILEVIK